MTKQVDTNCGACGKQLKYEEVGSLQVAKCCGRRYSVETVEVTKFRKKYPPPPHSHSLQNYTARHFIDANYQGDGHDTIGTERWLNKK